MKKRFIVAINSMTTEQEKEFVEYLRGQKCGYWHWIENVWLITNPTGNLSTREMRDEVMRIAPNAQSIALDMNDSKAWAGKGPQSKDRDMFAWFRQTWTTD